MVVLAGQHKLPRKEVTSVLRNLLDQYGNFRALRLKAYKALLELGGHKKRYCENFITLFKDWDYGFRQLVAQVCDPGVGDKRIKARGGRGEVCRSSWSGSYWWSW